MFQLLDKVPASYQPSVWNEEQTEIINKGDVPIWSADFPPPAIGEVIVIRINGIGKAVVTGYCLTEGFLGVMAKPLNPPKWFVEQNGGNISSCVFGREINLIEKRA